MAVIRSAFDGPGDSRTRSLIKALSYRALMTAFTFTIVYIFTGSIQVSGWVAVVEVIGKTLLYYLHERAWIWLFG